jgi:hypothetical protein
MRATPGADLTQDRPTTHEPETMKPTKVHRNLNRGAWSVTEAGAPVRHVETFTLTGVTFKVSAAGRARVLAKRVRAVHAWAIGTPAPMPAQAAADLVPVTYNPYRADTFTRTDTGEAVTAAALVIFTREGAALAQF